MSSLYTDNCLYACSLCHIVMFGLMCDLVIRKQRKEHNHTWHRMFLTETRCLEITQMERALSRSMPHPIHFFGINMFKSNNTNSNTFFGYRNRMWTSRLWVYLASFPSIGRTSYSVRSAFDISLSRTQKTVSWASFHARYNSASL